MKTKPGMLVLFMILMTALFVYTAYAQSTLTTGDFQYVLDGGGNATIICYTGAEGGTLVIPDQLDGNPVSAIGTAAFLGNKFTSIVIPAGLTAIMPGVFGNCYDLTTFDVAAGNPVYEQVDGILFDKSQKWLHTYPIARAATDYQVPYGMQGIGSGAFFGCEQLTSLALPEGLTAILENAFYGCKNILSLTIPNGVTQIGNSAFSMCAALHDINIPGSVNIIGTGIFDGCLNLALISVAAENPVFEVVDGVLFDKTQKLLHTYPQALSAQSYQVPAGTEHIGSLAFSSCSKLASVSIPDSVISIGESAFYSCKGLTSMVLPKGLTRLEASVFTACVKLKSVEVPDGVTQIGPQAFYNCADLRQVNIPYGVTSLEPYAFAYCAMLYSIVIPGSVLNIGDGAFMACDFMPNIVIPPGVQTIGAYAFGECTRLTWVSLPESLSGIGENAFYDCEQLVASVVENSYAHEYFYKNKLPFTFGKP